MLYTSHRDDKDSSDDTKTVSSSESADDSTEEAEKYYPGTEILSFTGVTGIDVSDTCEDEGDITYTYEVNSFKDFTDYVDALENDGYEINNTTYNGMHFTVCRKNRNQITIGY